jgi:hypothetical protein
LASPSDYNFIKFLLDNEYDGFMYYAEDMNAPKDYNNMCVFNVDKIIIKKIIEKDKIKNIDHTNF